MSTDETKKKYPEQELTKKIIGIAFQAQNEIGSGFAEKILLILSLKDNYCEIPSLALAKFLGAFFSLPPLAKRKALVTVEI